MCNSIRGSSTLLAMCLHFENGEKSSFFILHKQCESAYIRRTQPDAQRRSKIWWLEKISLSLLYYKENMLDFHFNVSPKKRMQCKSVTLAAGRWRLLRVHAKETQAHGAFLSHSASVSFSRKMSIADIG